MIGVHDLGGMHGLGPIDPEPEEDEPVFHQAWEGRIFAMSQACSALGRWSIDASRHARERLDPVVYLRTSYFEKWLLSLESLLVEHGLLTDEEIARGSPTSPADEDVAARRLTPAQVTSSITSTGRRFDVEPTAPPRFRPGDRVRLRPVTTPGHTRAVRYAQGRFGTVEAHRGCHVLPDHSAHADAAGEHVGAHLYSVSFTADELWGAWASPHDTVRVDLWEPYLEAAT